MGEHAHLVDNLLRLIEEWNRLRMTSTEAKPEKIDVKKMLGNPKITFVVGK